MNGKKIFGWILKVPLILLNLVTLGVGIYASMGLVPGFLISWAAPAIIGGMQIAYIIGAILINKARKDNQVDVVPEQYSEEQYTAEEYSPTQ